MAAALQPLDYRALPKAELHSHLNGTIRASTLQELLLEHAPSLLPRQPPPAASTLASCFAKFALIHAAVCTPAAVARVAREAVEDAAQDGVRYLELRTTPRALPCGASSSAYLEAVAQGILAGTAAAPRCAVRLLLSLDRAAGAAAWEACLALAQAWRARLFLGLQPFPQRPCALVVGLDVSGHPGRGSLAELLPLLQPLRAPAALLLPGAPPPLPLSLHLGELPGDEEVAAALAFAPERLGHMCCLTPQRLALVAASAATIELCPTSNHITLQLPSLAAHPTLPALLASRTLRLALCTDDCGVFDTCLSREYERVAAAFGLSEARMQALARGSFDSGFAPKDVLLAAAAL